ncbi:MAG: TIGR04211 family SH3 domain-containing protein [Pseudomonadota bacterium]
MKNIALLKIIAFMKIVVLIKTDAVASRIFLFLTIVCITTPAVAETQYITDTLSTPLRSSPVNDAKPVGNPLTSGNPVDVLQRSPDGKWARVRFQQLEGWLPTTFLQKEQAARDRLLELQARFEAIDREQKTSSSQSREMEVEVQSLRASLQQAQTERDTALQQLGELKLTAAGPQKLAASNQTLSAKAAAMAIDNERLRAEVERLNHDQKASFFFYGGLVVFGGMLVGWLMARQSGRRSTGW